MYADVPAQYSFTLYPLTGDVFAWLCIAGSVIFLLAVVFKIYYLRAKASYAGGDSNPTMKTSPDLG
jgi:hypothetical protein